MKKHFRATLLTCLLALSVFAAQPVSVFAGDTDSPGVECTENCPPPNEDPIDPPAGTASADTEPPADDLTTTIIGIIVGLTDLL